MKWTNPAQLLTVVEKAASPHYKQIFKTYQLTHQLHQLNQLNQKQQKIYKKQKQYKITK